MLRARRITGRVYRAIENAHHLSCTPPISRQPCHTLPTRSLYNATSVARTNAAEIRAPPPGSADNLSPPVAHAAYDVLRHVLIAEFGATATHYRHLETGAELVSVCCAEVEKVFGIAFRTPVSDSRGVPHILEHSVLCGSRKYPVKEPFVELLKSSLQTYLNAMTYPDRTVRRLSSLPALPSRPINVLERFGLLVCRPPTQVYPVASPNLKDFYQ